MINLLCLVLGWDLLNQFIIHLIINLNLIFKKFLNPAMIYREGGHIGRFLKSIKNIYIVVSLFHIIGYHIKLRFIDYLFVHGV